MTTSVRLPERMKERIRNIMNPEVSFSKKINYLVEKGLEQSKNILEEEIFEPDIRIISQKVDFCEDLSPREISYLIVEIYNLFAESQKTPNLESCMACSKFAKDLFGQDFFSVGQEFLKYLGRNIQEKGYTSVKEGVLNINEEICSNNNKISYLERAQKTQELMNVLCASVESYPENFNSPYVNEIIKEHLPTFLTMVKYKNIISSSPHQLSPHYFSKDEFFSALDYQKPENDLQTKKYRISLSLQDPPALNILFKERDVLYFFSYLEMIDIFSFADIYEEMLKSGSIKINLNGEKVKISARNEGEFNHLAIFSGVTMFFEADEIRLFFKAVREFTSKNEETIKKIKLQFGDF